MQVQEERIVGWLRRCVAMVALAAMVGLFVCPARPVTGMQVEGKVNSEE